MKRKVLLMVLSVSVVSVWYGMAQFTEKRIKKGPSMATLKEELDQIDHQSISKDHLTETLAQFEPLWEVLNQVERMRLVNLVIESAVYEPQSRNVKLTFRTTGITQQS